ncbi:hypothetical protein KEM55_007158, partial [Ascosphaera atra]
ALLRGSGRSDWLGFQRTGGMVGDGLTECGKRSSNPWTGIIKLKSIEVLGKPEVASLLTLDGGNESGVGGGNGGSETSLRIGMAVSSVNNMSGGMRGGLRGLMSPIS